MSTCIVCNKNEVLSTGEGATPVCLDCQNIESAREVPEAVGRNKSKNVLSPQNKEEYASFCEAVAEEGDRYGKFWTPERRKGYLEQGISFVMDIHEKQVDTIVILDTSARPLGLFFQAIWKRLFPQKKSPEIKFMVGDRRDRYESDFYEDRSLKLQAPKVQDTFKLSADQAFNGKTVLVLDEYGNTGGSLEKMKKKLSIAFPDIKNILLGITSWSFNDGKSPDFIDIQPPTLSKSDPTSYGEIKDRRYEVGWMVFRQSKHIKKGEKNWFNPEKDSVVSKRDLSIPAGVNTIGSRLYNVGKFETTDQVSLGKADQAIKYCEENGDQAGLERAKKIRQAYLDL